jgi:hypothetical protein
VRIYAFSFSPKKFLSEGLVAPKKFCLRTSIPALPDYTKPEDDSCHLLEPNITMKQIACGDSRKYVKPKRLGKDTHSPLHPLRISSSSGIRTNPNSAGNSREPIRLISKNYLGDPQSSLLKSSIEAALSKQLAQCSSNSASSLKLSLGASGELEPEGLSHSPQKSKFAPVASPEKARSKFFVKNLIKMAELSKKLPPSPSKHPSPDKIFFTKNQDVVSSTSQSKAKKGTQQGQ